MGMKLNVNEALRVMAQRVGKSLAQISREMEIGTPANLINMITAKSIRMRVAAYMCEKCGYKMVLVPEECEIEGAIEIKGELHD